MFKKLDNIFKNRNSSSIFISVIIFIIIFSISSTNFLYIFNKKVSDLYYEFSTVSINKDIVVIEIDDDTLTGRKNINGEIELEGLGRFPFDRKYYATVIDNLAEAGAYVIGIDIIFGEKSNDESDDILSESIKHAGNVVLGLWPNDSGIIQYPFDKFSKYVLASGYYLPNVDTRTGIVYSIKPFSKFRNSDIDYDHFAVSILRAYYAKIFNSDKFLLVEPTSFPDKFVINDKIELIKSRINKNEVLINYSDSSNFNKASFLDIYYNQFNKDDFKDKIIVIGATAKGIKDIFSTPIGTEYGVYTHVNLINTVLTKNGIKYLDVKLEWFLLYLLIVLSVYFNISKSSYVLIFSNISIIAFFVISLMYITIFTNVLLNYPIELILSLIFSLAISNVVKYLIENKHKTKLNKALSEYVSADIAAEILSGNGKVNLNGENKKIAIFFSDIEGFTSISEKFSPEALVSFLREYLSDMSDIIMDNKGFINKYEGDAIMALWGVFDDTSAMNSYDACYTALKQQESLKKLNIDWKERGFLEIKARIGIHIGNAIIGNIGSEGRKMEFTALGDNVNLASRLEGVNKFYGTYICASEDIYELEKENFDFRYLDKIKVKGKDNSIKIYELLSLKGETSKKMMEIKNDFEKGVNLYLKRDFIGAKEIFEKLILLGDNAPKMYLDMCEIYIKNPPNSDWEGISVMESK